MRIPDADFHMVRAVNIDEHRTVCAYGYWESMFPAGTYLGERIAIIKEALGADFTRSELVNFYQMEDVGPETKFVAAMLWGHEAPAGGRRDSRGPWKLSKMFAQPSDAQAAIRSVSLDTETNITKAYRLLDKALDRCGPNFFTKHFYFLGKAQGLTPYPLIFDDRVASGLIKIMLQNQLPQKMVKISASRKPEAYLQYLAFAKREAVRIGCSLDQVEYYLFNL